MDKIRIRITSRKILMIVFSIIFMISAILLVKKLNAYHYENKKFEEVREQLGSSDRGTAEGFVQDFMDETSDAGATDPSDVIKSTAAVTRSEEQISYSRIIGDPEKLDENDILKKYADLKKQNDDLVGWITIPGFSKKIDYPLMQAKDNEYYLNRDFFNNISYSGSIFLDMRNDPSDPQRNMIIYGHAMNDKSMFGNLKHYPEKSEIYLDNDTIYLDLLKFRLEYKVFSTYNTDAEYNYRQVYFKSDQEYMDFFNRLTDMSVYDFGVSLNSLDRIITLSTCNNNLGKEKRSVIHAKLVRMIDYTSDSMTTNNIDTSDIDDKKIISANVYLSKLSVEQKTDDIVQEIVLTPLFDTAVRLYSCEVPAGTKWISIGFTASDPEAVIKVTNNDLEVDHENIQITKEASIIKVWVTSRDSEYSRIYSITVNRQMEEFQ